MSLYTKICVALFGICGGFVVLFAMDMTLNSGRFAAHALHAKTPECSRTCHESADRQNAPRAAPVMALPYLQSTYRPVDSSPGPWRYPLLGVRLAAEGGH